MKCLLKLVESFLPLEIEGVQWDSDNFLVNGLHWSFSTTSAWRVVDNTSIRFACYDENMRSKEHDLIGLSIVSARVQGVGLSVDPIFGLSDDSFLEIFSTEIIDPWILTLPNGTIWVGNS